MSAFGVLGFWLPILGFEGALWFEDSDAYMVASTIHTLKS